MIVVAGAGLVVNIGVMVALRAERRHDINIRGAFMHMLGDALSSIGIIIGGVVIAYTGLLWIDPHPVGFDRSAYPVERLGHHPRVAEHSAGRIATRHETRRHLSGLEGNRRCH